MITYEQIKNANETINTTNIKGKEYAEVNQRIKAFRMVYPEGSIITEMISNEGGVCVFRAVIKNDDRIIATGTAYEKEGSTFINRTSYIENCETSAIGRALGMAGFGIDTSVASAEEVQNAQLNQVRYATETQVSNIRKLAKNEKSITDYYQVDNLMKLTMEQASEVLTKLKRNQND